MAARRRGDRRGESWRVVATGQPGAVGGPTSYDPIERHRESRLMMVD
jgi:hypothetical protein